ncbi:MAG: hypothetical protein RL693_1187 [Verrucomicrobiota bacterium]|jgi:hypothetical protein
MSADMFDVSSETASGIAAGACDAQERGGEKEEKDTFV